MLALATRLSTGSEGTPSRPRIARPDPESTPKAGAAVRSGTGEQTGLECGKWWGRRRDLGNSVQPGRAECGAVNASPASSSGFI